MPFDDKDKKICYAFFFEKLVFEDGKVTAVKFI